MLKTLCSCTVLALLLLPMSARGDNRDRVRDLAVRYGFPAPRQGRGTITLHSGCSTLAFETNSRKLLFNGVLIWMNDPLAGNGNDSSVHKSDVARIVDPLLRPDRTLISIAPPVVVIDPGHGGADTGATGRKVAEKTAVLDIASRVQKCLQAFHVNVKLTRESDVALVLEDRSAAARRMGATVFLSIHLNSADNADAAGLETYTMTAPGFTSTSGENGNTASEPGNEFDAANTLLAYQVHKAVLAQTGAADRGIKHARFDVLTRAPCPAALIECAFISNTFEDDMVSMENYRNVLAEGIAQGIMAYLTNARESR